MSDISADQSGYTSCMAEEGEIFHPGIKVTQSGIYQCDAGCGHQWSTDVQGNVFPPLPKGCKGGGWRLATKTPRSGEETYGS
ncbi:MAG: hypothetical protein JWQ95_5404 [Sphaerisporangium sp.]|jgi:hypothetical protein|nr:hypothetical protein [Sphaerisporangium sp.]